MTLDEKQNRIIKLVNQLNDWTKKYDEGHPDVSDEEWDNTYFELLSLEKETEYCIPSSPTQSINYQILVELPKVEHNHPMLSLDKTKDWNGFLDYFSGKQFIIMPKLDGLTCSLHYFNGKLVSAETRGNGIIGEDILHNAKVIPSIPKEIKYKGNLILDGEIICTEDIFNKYYSNEYANPRNFAAGSIRLLDSKECESRNLTFVVWNVVSGFEEFNEDSFFNKMNLIKLFGFEVTPMIAVTASTDQEDLREMATAQAVQKSYPIDGLVGRFDSISFGNSLGSTDHHSRAAYAFKFYDVQYETNLFNIEWSMGRTGVLTPVANFSPVDIEGTIVERASLHNISIMQGILGMHPFFGQKISVSKRNMIIPQVEWAESSEDITNSNEFLIPKLCPFCNQPLQQITSAGGTNSLICLNKDCGGKFINRLTHFCGKKGLDIKGISSATLEKLVSWGWVENLCDIFNLKNYSKVWIDKEGFGEKSVSNILSSIDSSIDTELSTFITALGIPLIGGVASKEIAKVFLSWEDFREAIDKKYSFDKLNGFGVEMCYSLLNFNYTEADKLASILRISNNSQSNKEINSSLLTNKAIVITGKLTIYKNREELKEQIERLGGKVVNAISKNTYLLINNDLESKSQKNQSAQKLGIPIMSEQEFFEKYLKNS